MALAAKRAPGIRGETAEVQATQAALAVGVLRCQRPMQGPNGRVVATAAMGSSNESSSAMTATRRAATAAA